MNKLNHLFQQQTTILLNHTFSNLLKLFINPKETKIFLYTAIIPTKESTKKELRRIGKSVPHLLRYEVWATKSTSKLTISLIHSPYSEITVYDVKLLQSQPSASLLKTISTVIVSKYRPLPTKIDKEFSELSKKYFNYLNYNQSERRWNSGITRKEKIKNDVQKMNIQDIENCYPSFSKDMDKLQLKYRAFTKILIDLYRKKGKNVYLNSNQNTEITTSFSYDYGLSIFLTFYNENRSNHELVKLSEFTPIIKFKDQRITSAIISCIAPTLKKIYT